jgi:hypothetical protein
MHKLFLKTITSLTTFHSIHIQHNTVIIHCDFPNFIRAHLSEPNIPHIVGTNPVHHGPSRG